MHEINSLISFKSVLRDKPVHVIIATDDLDIIHNFYINIKRFSFIMHLTVKTDVYSQQLIAILIELIQLGLKSLVIESEKFEGIVRFLHNIKFYSSLEELQINVKLYLEDDLPIDKEIVNKRCDKLIKLNNKIKYFLKFELMDYNQKTKTFDITTIGNNLSEEQVELLFQLGKKFPEFTKYINYNKDLQSNDIFKKIYDFSREWNITKIIASNRLDRLILIAPYLSLQALNQKQKIFKNIYKRFIDISVENQCTDIIRWLIQQGVDTSCDYIGNINQANSCDINREVNFPLLLAWNKYERSHAIITFFLENESTVYDALAWCICTGDEIFFRDIQNAYKSKIDINKKIMTGFFSKLTLVQLMIFYKKTNIFLDSISNTLKDQKLEMANAGYPSFDQFQYNGWANIAVITHLGLYDMFVALFSDNAQPQIYVPTNTKNFNLIQLLFDGISREFKYTKYRDNTGIENNATRSNILKQFIKYLLDNKLYESAIQDLYIPEDDNLSPIPILHYVIIHHIYFIMADKINNFIIYLNRKYMIDKLKEEVVPLQLAIIEEDENNKYTIEAVEHLYSYYQNNNLLYIINDPLLHCNRLNLFQYAIFYKKHQFLKLITQWQDCPINKPFPVNHTYYPNWLPIHIAIFNAFYGNSSLQLLLARKDIRLDTRFPEGGNFSHHLVGLYPLSAIFYSYNPKKNDNLRSRNLSNLINILLPIVNRYYISNIAKREMFTEGLYIAVLHHNLERDSDNEIFIKLLLDNQANPFQPLNDGFRIIDIAHEKGLIYLFSDYLIQNSFLPISRPLKRLAKSKRQSELSQVTLTNYHVIEDEIAVVSLVRNEVNKKSADHVFLVIERIVNGLSEIHFIDFVFNLEKNVGEVRHEIITGRITEKLIFNCNKYSLMKIESINDIVAQSWEVTEEVSCKNILDAIKTDEGKSLDYFKAGSHSLFARSSKEGDNCYTWARKKLLKSDDPYIKRQLQPGLEEWLATVPRWKLINNSSWLNFFKKPKVIIVTSAAVAVTVGAIYQNSFQ